MDRSKVEKDVRAAIRSGEKVPMRGVGDAVARVTKAVGIKECESCVKRRESLNKLFPFKNKKK